jgi:hypothetical protein
MRHPQRIALSASLIAVCWLWTVAAEAQVVAEMTPDLVKAAIADTKADGCYDLKKGFACFTTPYSRVAFAAREARKKYAPFTELQVTPEMVAPVVEVMAWPQNSFVFGSGKTGPPISVSRIVIMPAKGKDPSQAIQPSEQVDLDRSYSNLLGATWEARGILARFPLAVVSVGNEVRVVYDGKGCADWHTKPSEECVFRFDLKGVR